MGGVWEAWRAVCGLPAHLVAPSAAAKSKDTVGAGVRAGFFEFEGAVWTNPGGHDGRIEGRVGVDGIPRV